MFFYYIMRRRTKKQKKQHKRNKRGGTRAAKQVMGNPDLVRYISEFNLIPGEKYQINDSDRAMKFVEETNGEHGLSYRFSYEVDGKPYQVIFYNVQNHPIDIKKID